MEGCMRWSIKRSQWHSSSQKQSLHDSSFWQEHSGHSPSIDHHQVECYTVISVHKMMWAGGLVTVLMILHMGVGEPPDPRNDTQPLDINDVLLKQQLDEMLEEEIRKASKMTDTSKTIATKKIMSFFLCMHIIYVL